MEIDIERSLSVFDSKQIDDAMHLVIAESDSRFNEYSRDRIIVLWALSNFMVKLGIKGPEDYYVR